MRSKSSSRSGFTLIELIAILVVIAILGAIAVPKMIQARAAKQRNHCIANLKQLYSAVFNWSVETKQASTAVPTDSQIFGPNHYLREKPLCPLGGSYSLNAISANPTCSKSAAPDFHTY